MRKITRARDQVELLAPWRPEVEVLTPWRREAFIKEARYPQEWRGEAPYGYLPSGRARNRPPSVLSDPDDPDSEVIDPSEIIYKRPQYSNSISAYHPNGDHLGNYSWEDDGGQAHIGIAQVDPRYQRQGVAGGIIDHIREHYQPDLVHSGHQGNGSLSYQGRAGALRDLGNTEEEHNDYFNTTPYNYGETEPSRFGHFSAPTDEQRQAHAELMKQFEEDRKHPNYTGTRSSRSYDSDMYDEDGDKHDYGYDSGGDYVGLNDGGKDSEGYSEKGYNSEGYDRDGRNSEGYDSEGRDEYGYHAETGLNREGETRHGYTPGDGTPPEGTVPMSQMASYRFPNRTRPATGSDAHQQMMDNASLGASSGFSPTMYAVRHTGEVSPETGGHHVGNGDTLYSSLERARQVAYHPDDPSQDKNIVSVDYGTLNPYELHTDASGKTPEDFHYAPMSGWGDAEDTASTPADLVHDPERHQRILGDLGHGWSQSTEPPLSENSGFEYTDPTSGRSGRMYQQGRNGIWRTEHQPEFGRKRQEQHDNYRDAADAIRQGTALGPTMDQHALEVNNNYEATGGGNVDWEPHPSGQGLMAHTPHGDLHLNRDPDTGRWNWHAGPHGSQPGDEGNMRSPFTDSLNRAAASGVQAITRSPFHGGLRDELGEGWSPHPVSPQSYTRRLPSGNHAYVAPNGDGSYESGIQRDNGKGRPSSPIAYRDSPDLDQALEFIQHRESPIPASALGEGWEDRPVRTNSFPSYAHDGHPSGAAADVVRAGVGGWRPVVYHRGDSYQGPLHKTPQEAASWAHGVMDDLGNTM